MKVVGEQRRQRPAQRLVVVVLTDDDDLSGSIARLDHRLEVFEQRKRGLLHQYVLAGSERVTRHVYVVLGGQRDNDRIDAGIVDRVLVGDEVLGAAEVALELQGASFLAARVAADEFVTHRA